MSRLLANPAKNRTHPIENLQKTNKEKLGLTFYKLILEYKVLTSFHPKNRCKPFIFETMDMKNKMKYRLHFLAL